MNSLSCRSRGQKSAVGQAGLCSFWIPQESIHFLAFPVSRGCLPALGQGHFFHLQNQQQQVFQSPRPRLWPLLSSPSLAPILLSPSFSCDYTLVTQDNLSSQGPSSHLQSALCHVWWQSHRFKGLGCEHLWGAHHSCYKPRSPPWDNSHFSASPWVEKYKVICLPITISLKWIWIPK